jgi:hypothetical protein
MPLHRYKVTYRVVPHSSAGMSILFKYNVDAGTRWAAEGTAANLLQEDMHHLQGYFDEEEIKRTTVSRR